MLSCRETPEQLYDAYVFDLDGTVLLGEALIPSAVEAIGRLRELGRRVVFVSNNTTYSPSAYARLLTAHGLPTPSGDVVTSTMVLIDYLRCQEARPRLMVLGEEPLRRSLSRAGFALVQEGEEAEMVVASFDRTLTYRKLRAAFDAIRGGARFIATNRDRFRPVEGGGGEPDAAAVVGALEACTGVACELVTGKPSRLMSNFVLARLALAPGRCIMVGDRVETDVAMALDAGMSAALTLTGATSRAQAARLQPRPTYVVETLAELIPAS